MPGVPDSGRVFHFIATVAVETEALACSLPVIFIQRDDFYQAFEAAKKCRLLAAEIQQDIVMVKGFRRMVDDDGVMAASASRLWQCGRKLMAGVVHSI